MSDSEQPRVLPLRENREWAVSVAAVARAPGSRHSERGMRERRGRRLTRPCLGTVWALASRSALLRFALSDHLVDRRVGCRSRRRSARLGRAHSGADPIVPLRKPSCGSSPRRAASGLPASGTPSPDPAVAVAALRSAIGGGSLHLRGQAGAVAMSAVFPSRPHGAAHGHRGRTDKPGQRADQRAEN